MAKLKELLKCEKGVSLITYLLGLGFIVTITAVVIGNLNLSLSSFHDVGVQYIQDLGSSGL